MSNFLEKLPLLVLSKLVLLVFRVRSPLAGDLLPLLNKLGFFRAELLQNQRLLKSKPDGSLPSP